MMHDGRQVPFEGTDADRSIPRLSPTDRGRHDGERAIVDGEDVQWWLGRWIHSARDVAQNGEADPSDH